MNLHFLAGSRNEKLAIMVVIIMAVFIGRLFWLQIVQHDHFMAEARREYLGQDKIVADRGEIYAMNDGVPVRLVMNENIYTVFVDPAVVGNPRVTSSTIRRIAGDKTFAKIDSLIAAKPSRYQIVAKNLTPQQASDLKKENLLGVGLQKETQRVYPEGQLAASVLGYAGTDARY